MHPTPPFTPSSACWCPSPWCDRNAMAMPCRQGSRIALWGRARGASARAWKRWGARARCARKNIPVNFEEAKHVRDCSLRARPGERRPGVNLRAMSTRFAPTRVARAPVARPQRFAEHGLQRCGGFAVVGHGHGARRPRRSAAQHGAWMCCARAPRLRCPAAFPQRLSSGVLGCATVVLRGWALTAAPPPRRVRLRAWRRWPNRCARRRSTA